MNRKLLSFLYATLVMIMVLAGCSEEKKKEITGNINAPSSSAATVKIELLKQATQKMPDVDFVKQELDKKLGINISISQESTADQLANKVSVRAAAGSLPELIEFKDKNQLEQFAVKGMLLDLTPYMSKLEQAKEFMGESSFKKGTFNGKVYAIAKAPYFARHTYWVRKDWLDKLGMKAPTTLDELFEVSKAFTEKDPDGNGKKDTFGITGNSKSIFSPIFGAYGIGSGAELLIKDGKLFNSLYDPVRKDALTTVKKFLDAGVVDPDFATNNQPQANDKAFKGQAGIYYQQWIIYRDVEVQQWKTANPNAEWVRINEIKGPGGAFSGVVDEGATSGYVALPKSLEKEPAKLQKIFDLLNYVSTQEGNQLVSYGRKDVDFKIENGKMTVTNGTDADYTWVYQLTGRPELEFLALKYPNQAKLIEESNRLPYLKSYNGLVNIPQGFNYADADRFINEETFKFIYGKSNIAEYDKFLQTLGSTFNYNVYMDSAEKQLKQQGLIK